MVVTNSIEIIWRPFCENLKDLVTPRLSIIDPVFGIFRSNIGINLRHIMLPSGKSRLIDITSDGIKGLVKGSYT